MDAVVGTRYGQVRGLAVDGVSAFLGIPYAAPPVGAGRLRPPRLGHRQMMGGALGEDPPQRLADTMHRAWVEFAAKGDPGWPRYDLARRPVMRFDLTSSVVEDPYARERTLWQGLR